MPADDTVYGPSSFRGTNAGPSRDVKSSLRTQYNKPTVGANTTGASAASSVSTLQADAREAKEKWAVIRRPDIKKKPKYQVHRSKEQQARLGVVRAHNRLVIVVQRSQNSKIAVRAFAGADSQAMLTPLWSIG